jgi:hypothetical protein
MRIDESGGDDESSRVEHASRSHARTVAEERDAVTADADVRDAPGRSGAVVDSTAPDQHVDGISALE